MTLPTELTPQHGITHVFSAKSAREGGVVRRKIRDIERYVGLDAFLKNCIAVAITQSKMQGNW